MAKFYFVIASILFSNCISYGQNCNDLLKNLGNVFSKGDYNEALKIAESGMSICSKELGYESLGNMSFINTLAVIYHQTGNYNKAEVTYKDCLSITKSLLGEENQYYATTLNSLAELYFQLGNYTKSEPLQIQAAAIRKKILGEENIDYATSINNLARLYHQMDRYKEAEPFYIEAQMIYKKVLGEENENYATLLNDMSIFYSLLGDHTKAITFQTQAVELNKSLFGNNDFKYAKSLRNLAQLYISSGDYIKADVVNTESLNIIKKQNREKNDYVFNLNIIADQYYRIGNFEKAEEIYLENLNIRKRIVGEEHLDYANSLIFLANIYNKTGKYEKAEPLIINALNIIKKNLGEENIKYIQTLNNLGNLYSNLKNYSKAQEYYNKALSFTKKVLGENNTDYTTYLNNLAGIFTLFGDYSKAEPLFLKSLSIQKKIKEKPDLNYALTLNNLANLYHKLKYYLKAEEIYIEALTVIKDVLGENNPDYALILDNIAVLYDDLGDYSNSEQMHIKAINLRKKYLGEEHPLYAVSLNNLAHSYELRNNFLLASIQLASSIRIIKNNWLNNLCFLNTSEVDKFINSNEFEFEGKLSFLSRHPQEIVKSDLFDFNIFYKNIRLNSSNLLEKTIKKSNDSLIQLKWNYYKEINFQISKQLQLDINKQNILHKLKKQKDSVEKDLLLSFPNFKDALNNNKISWLDIKHKMKDNEVVLDFVSFRYHNIKWIDTLLYGVFVIRKEWEEPRFINLFKEEKLASLFDSSNTRHSINNLYCANNGLADTNCNSTLYNLIWHPMDSLLKGVKKVFISPSGLLNRVSFSAIPIPEGGRLIDRYSIEQLSNIRTIAEKSTAQEDNIKSMILIGGADFNVEPTFSDKSNVNYVTTDTLFSDIRSLHGGKWSYLAGTENEVNAIKNITAPSKISMNLLTGSNASEEGFKKISSENATSPSVIHIATHGFAFTTPKMIPNEGKFVLQDNKTNVFRMSEDPLTRAGLVMAGGNQVWTTGFPYPNHDDGILTAREVSELNLNGCVLATLSACETGLGEIKGSEGVFGLQRAFKMAGVKYLIVSLWKVPDAQTTEFMQLFYSCWLLQKLPIQDAFRQTQITMSKKYFPYQWAAFVLIE